MQTIRGTALTHQVVILTFSTSLIGRGHCADFSNVLAYPSATIAKDIMAALFYLFQKESLG